MPQQPPQAPTPPLVVQARVTPASLADVPLGVDPAQYAVLTAAPLAVDCQSVQTTSGPALLLVVQVVVPPELLRAPSGRLLNAQGQATIPPDLAQALQSTKVQLIVERHLLGPTGLAGLPAAGGEDA